MEGGSERALFAEGFFKAGNQFFKPRLSQRSTYLNFHHNYIMIKRYVNLSSCFFLWLSLKYSSNAFDFRPFNPSILSELFIIRFKISSRLKISSDFSSSSIPLAIVSAKFSIIPLNSSVRPLYSYNNQNPKATRHGRQYIKNAKILFLNEYFFEFSIIGV